MAATRPTRATLDDDKTVTRVIKRTRVLTTKMADDEPAAEKPIIKKATRKKALPKKIAPKKVAAKKSAAKKPVSSEPASEWNDPRGPRPARRSANQRLDDPPPATGAELVERVSWAIERELNQIEMIVGGHRVKPTQRTEAERRARTLASLARTLNEVARLRAQHQQRPDDDDDAMPRDLDEFRETLALRLERLLAAEPDTADGDVQPG